MIKSRHDTAFFQRSYSSGLDRLCCMDTPNVIASDQRERGNLENNKFHSIFCYFFSGLPRRDYVPPRNDGAFLQGFRSMQQRRLDHGMTTLLNERILEL
ncbi:MULTISPECIES: hypothetical protein [unclassified Rickettsia]|uniref:hypothetical protein n=1 Tax=unclassified Rickettsia TaxID=114295 RepID=UPI00313329CF